MTHFDIFLFCSVDNLYMWRNVVSLHIVVDFTSYFYILLMFDLVGESME